MKRIFVTAAIILGTGMLLVSCLKKDYNPPPDLLKLDPAIPVNLTISRLKDFYATTATAVAIDSEWTIYGIVTTEDKAGNFYKQVTIEDSTGGITISVDANSLYSKLPAGRKVYVKLKGLYYGFYNKFPQIGYSSDGSGGVTRIPQNVMDKYIIRANYPHQVPVSNFDGLEQLSKLNKSMLNRLVKIDNVEIVSEDLEKTYAAIPGISSGTDIKLTDCNGKTITLRNSAYASFQPYPLPRGKGSITALYATFGSKPQLIIRDTSDVKFYGDRCGDSSAGSPLLLDEDFASLANWNAQSVAGAQVWSIAQYGNPKPCALMTGYAGGSNANEDWLISRQLDLAGFNKISLQFETASKYNGNDLECYVSVDYPGTGAPATASWTLLPATYDQSNQFKFTSSGLIDLSSYRGRKVYIAFKYTSTASASASWELDNVRVTGE